MFASVSIIFVAVELDSGARVSTIASCLGFDLPRSVNYNKLPRYKGGGLWIDDVLASRRIARLDVDRTELEARVTRSHKIRHYIMGDLIYAVPDKPKHSHYEKWDDGTWQDAHEESHTVNPSYSQNSNSGSKARVQSETEARDDTERSPSPSGTGRQLHDRVEPEEPHSPTRSSGNAHRTSSAKGITLSPGPRTRLGAEKREQPTTAKPVGQLGRQKRLLPLFGGRRTPQASTALKFQPEPGQE